MMVSLQSPNLLTTAILVLLSAYQDSADVQIRRGCTVHPSDVSADSPLILRHRYKNGISPFHMPSDPGSDSLTFSSGDVVRLACPDADDNLLAIPNSPLMVYEVVAFCISNSTFSISGAAYNFNAIRCKLPPQSTMKEEGSCHIGSGKKYNVGFKLKRKFLGLIEVCYDTAKQSTLNAMYILSKSVGYHDVNLQMNSHFASSSFGTENTRTPDEFYSCKNQVKTLGHILGSSIQAKKYINCNHNSNMYFDKCHLAPKDDFLFEYQKKAANFYINTAPQWKAISTGNWNILQHRIRRYASIHKVDLTVVTGTMNVTTLQDASGTERDLYLSKDMRNKPTVPVPAMFWKLVLDRPRNAGIVFVCVNNPYHYDIHVRGYVICTDICNGTTSWFDGWNRLDISQGYVYCCTVDEFRSKSHIQPFPFRARRILH